MKTITIVAILLLSGCANTNTAWTPPETLPPTTVQVHILSPAEWERFVLTETECGECWFFNDRSAFVKWGDGQCQVYLDGERGVPEDGIFSQPVRYCYTEQDLG